MLLFAQQNLATAATPGVLLTGTPLSNFRQDLAGATPVTASGQLIGQWQDTSGNANHGTARGDAFKGSAQDVGGLRYGNIYSNLAFASGGGSTNAFYLCIAASGSYYGTLFSDYVGNTGFRLIHDGDLGGLSFSAGTGLARMTLTVMTDAALFTNMDKQAVEVWYDGTSLNLRINKGAVSSIATAAPVAGSAGFFLSADDAVDTNAFTGSFYYVNAQKNVVPTLAERNAIADAAMAAAGLAVSSNITAAQTLLTNQQAAALSAVATVQAAQTIPASTQSAALSLIAAIQASQVLPDSSQSAALANVAALQGAQVIPPAVQSVSLAAIAALQASQTQPAGTQSAQVVAIAAITAAQSLAAGVQTAALSAGSSALSISAAQTQLAVTQAAQLLAVAGIQAAQVIAQGTQAAQLAAIVQAQASQALLAGTQAANLAVVPVSSIITLSASQVLQPVLQSSALASIAQAQAAQSLSANSQSASLTSQTQAFSGGGSLSHLVDFYDSRQQTSPSPQKLADSVQKLADAPQATTPQSLVQAIGQLPVPASMVSPPAVDPGLTAFLAHQENLAAQAIAEAIEEEELAIAMLMM